MIRGIDHVVLVVLELDAAVADHRARWLHGHAPAVSTPAGSRITRSSVSRAEAIWSSSRSTISQRREENTAGRPSRSEVADGRTSRWRRATSFGMRPR